MLTKNNYLEKEILKSEVQSDKNIDITIDQFLVGRKFANSNRYVKGVQDRPNDMKFISIENMVASKRSALRKRSKSIQNIDDL